MKPLPALIASCLLLSAQIQSEPSAAYQRYQSLLKSAAPISDVLRAADEWLQTYERVRDARSLPPYLMLARFFAARGVRAEQIPILLEKGVAELSTPGSFTQLRTQSNLPFQDDIERTLAANVYTQIGEYPKALGLLATAGTTVTQTQPAQLDPVKGRIFEALRYSYWDGMSRLAMAEGRKIDALTFEHAILTNRRNVAAPHLIEEHRRAAQRLWKELGKPESEFAGWLAAGPQ